jgi:hypothetical protein
MVFPRGPRPHLIFDALNPKLPYMVSKELHTGLTNTKRR